MASTLGNNTSVVVGRVTMYFGYTILWALAPIVLGIISLVISLLIIITIATNKEFHTSGYCMLVSSSVWQQISSIGFSIIGPSLGVAYRFQDIQLAGNNIFTEMQEFLNLFGFLSSFMTLTIICVQRFIAVYFFNAYNRIFTKKVTATCIIVPLVVASVFTVPNLVEACRTYYSIDILFSKIDCPPGEIPIRDKFLMAFVGLIGFSVLLMSISYTAIAYKLFKLKNKITSTTTSKNPKRSDEVKVSIQFLIISFVYCLCPIQLVIYMLLIPYDKLTSFEHELVQSVKIVLWVVNYCIDPYIHISINNRLRLAVFKLLSKTVHGIETWRTSKSHSSHSGPGTLSRPTNNTSNERSGRVNQTNTKNSTSHV